MGIRCWGLARFVYGIGRQASIGVAGGLRERSIFFLVCAGMRILRYNIVRLNNHRCADLPQTYRVRFGDAHFVPQPQP